MRALKVILGRSLVGRILLLPYRLRTALSYYGPPLLRIPKWLLRSREFTNFTYDLDELNLEYLIAFVAEVTGANHTKIRSYVAELINDTSLAEHVRRLTRGSEFRHSADEVPRYARRIGWYALVRALKPRVVVESGIDKGLGSCVLAAALMRNESEGITGRFYGIDLDRNAGYLYTTPYSHYGEIIHGDSVATLQSFSSPVDMFIHDSNHTPEHERREFEAIAGKLSTHALVMSDNAHCTGELLAFAQRTGRRFLYFQERPRAHWYPGGGIGAAWSEQSADGRTLPNRQKKNQG